MAGCMSCIHYCNAVYLRSGHVGDYCSENNIEIFDDESYSCGDFEGIDEDMMSHW